MPCNFPEHHGSSGGSGGGPLLLLALIIGAAVWACSTSTAARLASDALNAALWTVAGVAALGIAGGIVALVITRRRNTVGDRAQIDARRLGVISPRRHAQAIAEARQQARDEALAWALAQIAARTSQPEPSPLPAKQPETVPARALPPGGGAAA
jgi:hypothetical protein